MVYLPLWKIWKSVGIIIPYIYIWKNNPNVPNHQPEHLLFGPFSPSSDPNFAEEPHHPHIRRHVTFGRLLRNWGWLKWRWKTHHQKHPGGLEKIVKALLWVQQKQDGAFGWSLRESQKIIQWKIAWESTEMRHLHRWLLAGEFQDLCHWNWKPQLIQQRYLRKVR